MHVPVLAAVHALVPDLPVPAAPAGTLFAAHCPLAATLAVIALCLWLRDVAQRIGLGFPCRLPTRSTPVAEAPRRRLRHDHLVATALTRKLS